MKLAPLTIVPALAVAILVFAGECHGTEAPNPSSVPPVPQLDVFPPSVAKASADGRGQTRISLAYAPSGSLWGEGLDETKVFLSEMDHQGGKDDSFTLRIGHGGQIYSLRGAFGESVPPSSKGSPWNDEVWQFVSVCTKYNGVATLLRAGPVPAEVAERLKKSPYESTYFVHNAGAYIPGNAAITNLYCPLLGSEISKDGRTYRTLNWGLVPQVRTIHRSPILYYCQTRDVGDGVIEMTYVVHNFSVRDDIVFDHLNAPWGGTRLSSLPFHYLSTPDGGLISRKTMAEMGVQKGINVQKTGGWNLSSVSEAPDSPSLSLVFGRDIHLEAQAQKAKDGQPHMQFANSIYRDWDATGGGQYHFTFQDWQTRPEGSWRNYEVAVVIPKFRLAPGTTIWYRSYLVVNRRDRTIELAKSLVEKVDYGLLTFDPATTPKVPVYVRDGKVQDVAKAGETPSFELFSKPVSGTMPLFLIENTSTGQEMVTSDPYIFVKKEMLDFGVPPEHPLYDYYKDAVGYSVDQNNSKWKRLLGFGYVSKPAEGSFGKLSDVLGPALFAKVDKYNLDLWVAQKSGGKQQ